MVVMRKTDKYIEWAADVFRFREILPHRRGLCCAQECDHAKSNPTQCRASFFAETFATFYLLFSPSGDPDFDRVIFNTEAHPLADSK